jgi:acetolactate synthase-1/2/3 large subunit
VRVDLPIVGDVKDVLSQLLKLTEKMKDNTAEFLAAMEPWHQEISAWKEKHPISYKSSTTVIKPQFVIQKLRELCDENAIISTDVGQHQMWTAQFFKFNSPRTLLTSGGLGTMGYGLPAAMGAQAAFPGRQVITICGDGGVQMNIQEMATLVQNKLPVKIVILNNNFLGMVRQWQELFNERRYSFVDIQSPDFVAVAAAYGIAGRVIDDRKDLPSALKQMMENKGSFLLEVMVTKENNVFPMVPQGCSVAEIRLK